MHPNLLKTRDANSFSPNPTWVTPFKILNHIPDEVLPSLKRLNQDPPKTKPDTRFSRATMQKGEIDHAPMKTFRTIATSRTPRIIISRSTHTGAAPSDTSICGAGVRTSTRCVVAANGTILVG